MAFDGNGNWISDFSAVADRDADIKILASRFDGIFIADIASSFENCLTKDGQVKTQTNFNANNYRVINVADPTSDKDAVNLQTLNTKDGTAVHKTGNETIAGTKTFSSTISGSITGNAGTVTNGVYTTGNQTIGGTKTFSSTISGSISGNAGTVTNGVYITGTQTITGNKTFSGTLKAVTPTSSDNSTNVATTAWVRTTGNGVVHTSSNETIGGNKTFTGSTTFSSSVSLGSSATSTTPSSATDSSTKVATTEFCQTVFANAVGTPRDVTILWGDGTGVGSPSEFTLSEDFTNFEQLGFMISTDSGDCRRVCIQSTYWLNYVLSNSGQKSVSLAFTSANTLVAEVAIYSYTHSSTPSTKTKFKVSNENSISYYIFGINRKVKNVPDPLA